MFNDDEPLDDKPSWNHVFEDISLKSQEEDETLPPAIETDYYTRPTESLTTRKTRYTTGKLCYFFNWKPKVGLNGRDCLGNSRALLHDFK